MSTRRRSSAAETSYDNSTTRAPTTQHSSAEWHGRYCDNRRCSAALTALSHTCADRPKHLRLSLPLLLYIYENIPQYYHTTYSFVQRGKGRRDPQDTTCAAFLHNRTQQEHSSIDSKGREGGGGVTQQSPDIRSGTVQTHPLAGIKCFHPLP